jgi:hypothetical protein
MRSTILVVVFLLLPVGSSMATEPGNVTPEAILAFRDICLKTAPTFSGAMEAAKSYGINEGVDSGSEPRLGFNEDKSMGMQLKTDECVITTASQKNKALTKQFIAAIGEYLKVPMAKKPPALITIDNQSFIVFHDRSDGETFVLLKKK